MTPKSRQAERARLIALHSATLVAFMAAAAAPTPLYRIYQEAWSFSPLVTSLIYAVYALSMLSVLLLFGSLPDRTGRRPVILIALALQMAALLTFLGARSAEWLMLARLIQGGATGLAMASLGAALLDIDREKGTLINAIAPFAGMGVGAVGSTLLSHYAPAPLHLGFALLLATFAVQFVGTVASAETASRPAPDAWSLRPRVSVPNQARAALAGVTPLNIAMWALGGFYLSLMPSLVAAISGPASAWLGGIAVGVLTLAGAVAVLVARRHAPAAALNWGTAALIAGSLVALAGANMPSPSALLTGSALAGIGLGAGFLGVMRTVLPLAEPHQRAGLMAAFYLESYLAMSLPAVAAGYAAQSIGLLTTANLFGGAVVLLALAAVLLTAVRHRRATWVELPPPA